MAMKSIFIFCTSAILVQVISGQCIGGPFNGFLGARGEPYGPYGCGPIASSGGTFPVTSVSPIAPTGITVISENAIEGILGVGGQLPFVGTVALEGAFPSAGVGSISYGCGSAIGMNSEGPVPTGILGASPYGPYGYGPVGCGCGGLY